MKALRAPGLDIEFDPARVGICTPVKAEVGEGVALRLIANEFAAAA